MNDQPSQRPKKPAPQLADYPHRATDTIRFADLDPQGHVNNAVFATYFETGRVAMFRNPDLGIGVPDGTFILVRAEIDFMRELRWPGTVEIGTALAEFGRTSFKVAQVIFNEDACCGQRALHHGARRQDHAPPAAADRGRDRALEPMEISGLEHDPEKWEPVFGLDHAQ